MAPTPSNLRLVFVHGSGGTGRVWRFQTERFPDARAVTLPGHPDGALLASIEEATAWLRAELADVERGALVLVGHSLGGAIALEYALDDPQALAGIVLVGSGARLRVHPATLSALEQAVDRPQDFPRFFDDAWKKVPAGLAEDLMRDAERLGPEPFLSDLRACDRFDVIERLGEIETPTLAVVGTEDVMTPPKYSEFLRERMPRTQVEIVEGGTHYVFAEYPEAVNDAIARFVSELG